VPNKNNYFSPFYKSKPISIRYTTVNSQLSKTLVLVENYNRWLISSFVVFGVQ